MKDVRHLRLLGLAMVLAVFDAGVASAATTVGKVTFVGTIGEEVISNVYHARLRVRVHGTCDTDAAEADRWIHIRSGRMDNIFTHNSVNMRNAYSTLMSALLSGKDVQIDGLPNCSTTNVIDMDLWTGQVGLF
jgi:hypothetical protein